MSHYYARIPTSARRTIATARGHKSTGIAAEVLTAEGGVRVTIRHRNGRDRRYDVTLRDVDDPAPVQTDFDDEQSQGAD